MELPSINSTTSISDNQDLRNHYEKLLFKNQSEISLPDYPNRVIGNNNNNQNSNHTHTAGAINRQLDNFSFITGFKNLNINQTIIPTSTTAATPSTSSSSTFDNNLFQLPQNGPKFNSAYSNSDTLSSHYPFQRHLSLPETQQYLNHNPNQKQNVTWNHDEGRRYTSSNTFITTTAINMPNNMPLNSNGYANQNPSQLIYPPNRFSHLHPSNMGPISNHNIRKHHSISNGDITINRYNLDNSINNQPSNYIGEQNINNSRKPNEVTIDDGLLLIDGTNIASSTELHQFYETCGKNYFSSNVVFPFIDYIKSLLSSESDNTYSNTQIDQRRKTKVLNFLKFLHNCNLDFISQISKSNNNNDNNDDSISNQHMTSFKPKGLVLVALKNGKLELLSTTQNVNLQLKRGDLVLIDGDRGKDLVQIVESDISLNLALFANFLKKKVHFDSLITAKNQHYPNDKFIQTLINSRNGIGEKLNNKLYDITELTQFIVPSKQVLRFATPWEVMTNLQYKFQDELKALHVAQLKLQNLNNLRNNDGNFTNVSGVSSNSTKKPLNIKILNSEFQFDRKKLTFYYICEERNDFRELIKELFKYYKTRIWLCAIPNNLNIDSKYYDNGRKELSVYEQMIRSQQFSDSYKNNQFSLYTPTTSFDEPLNIPPLDKIELDNFQIGIYKELLEELF